MFYKKDYKIKVILNNKILKVWKRKNIEEYTTEM